MKKFQIRYSTEFANHLEAFLTDLTKKSPQTVNKLRDDIKQTLLNLKSYLRLGNKISSPIERLNKYRKIVLIYDYLLFYRLDEKKETVYVLDIIHGRQDYWHLLPLT
jgi:plasmid stabilization system protein ParE